LEPPNPCKRNEQQLGKTKKCKKICDGCGMWVKYLKSVLILNYFSFLKIERLLVSDDGRVHS
jgi:hypothetical protein